MPTARSTSVRRVRRLLAATALCAPLALAAPTAAEVTPDLPYASAVMAEATDLTQLRQSSDYTDDDAEVLRLYRAFFLREPDIGGAQYWIGLRRDGLAMTQISANFAVSTEFGVAYGSLDDESFVAQVYVNVFGRDADDEGLAYWLGELTSGTLDRGGVVYWMTLNTEMITNFPYGALGSSITWEDAQQATLPVGTCDFVTEGHRTLHNGRSVWTGPDGEFFRIAETRVPAYSEAVFRYDDDDNSDIVFIVECIYDGSISNDGVVAWLSTQDPHHVPTNDNIFPNSSIAWHESARFEDVDGSQVLTIDYRYYNSETPFCCPIPAVDWYWEFVDGRFEYIRT